MKGHKRELANAPKDAHKPPDKLESWRFSNPSMQAVSAALADAERYARTHRDVGTYGATVALMRQIGEVFEIMDAFIRAHGRRIHGKGGVSSLLPTSPNNLYVRLRMLGLTAEDFRQPDVTLDGLVRKSAILRAKFESLLSHVPHSARLLSQQTMET